MTDHNKKPHKWAAVIKAWADGKETQYRISWDSGDWSAWCTMPREMVFSEHLNYEYRVKPNIEPHRWQREREAFLAGHPVEFRNKAANETEWTAVDSWLEAECRRVGSPLWDRDWLEFRIPTTETEFVHVFRSPLPGCNFKHRIKLTFRGKELKEAVVL